MRISLYAVFRAVGTLIAAAAIILAAPSVAVAYWRNGIWIEPGQAPYPYHISHHRPMVTAHRHLRRLITMPLVLHGVSGYRSTGMGIGGFLGTGAAIRLRSIVAGPSRRDTYESPLYLSGRF